MKTYNDIYHPPYYVESIKLVIPYPCECCEKIIQKGIGNCFVISTNTNYNDYKNYFAWVCSKRCAQMIIMSLL